MKESDLQGSIFRAHVATRKNCPYTLSDHVLHGAKCFDRNLYKSEEKETSIYYVHIWHILSMKFMFNVFDMVSTSISIKLLDVSYIEFPVAEACGIHTWSHPCNSAFSAPGHKGQLQSRMFAWEYQDPEQSYTTCNILEPFAAFAHRDLTADLVILGQEFLRHRSSWPGTKWGVSKGGGPRVAPPKGWYQIRYEEIDPWPPRKGVMFLEGHSRHQRLIFGEFSVRCVSTFTFASFQ